jgi:hypothetical protein
MSTHGEEDLLIKEIEQEQKRMKPRVCVISKQGLTLMGYSVPWLVVVLVVAALFFWLNKQGMLNDSVSSVVSETPTSTSTSTSNVMSGGFKRPNLGNPGQVRKMFGH